MRKYIILKHKRLRDFRIYLYLSEDDICYFVKFIGESYMFSSSIYLGNSGYETAIPKSRFHQLSYVYYNAHIIELP